MEGVDVIKDNWWAGLLAFPYIAYRIWQTLKQDNKGDNVDARIQSFTSQIQERLDKTLLQLDALQAARDKLVDENATLKSRIGILENDNLHLRAEIDKSAARTGTAQGSSVA